MDFKTMSIEELESRRAAIVSEIDSPEADLAALEDEIRGINAELEDRKAAEAKRNELRQAVAGGAGVTKERTKEPKMEVRKEQLVDALAEYIKGRATAEQRALLTAFADGGTVPVSQIVDDWVWTDWDKSPILSRIRKVAVKGSYAVGYEASATGAVVHEEGAKAPDEETLTLGLVQFLPQFYKKWIKVSDTVLSLRGQAFMDYLLREFGHQLAIALENAVVDEIAASDLAVAVENAMDSTAAMAGFAALSDEASNPVVIISKATYADIMNARTDGGDKIDDPFSGMEVLFNNSVDGMLVGDLDGIVGQFPDGDDFKFIIDDKSLAELDLVKIVGKILADIHLVRPRGFAIVNPQEGEGG